MLRCPAIKMTATAGIPPQHRTFRAEAVMPMSNRVRKWIGLPSRIALLLGIGASSAVGARADAPPFDPAKTPSQVLRPGAASAAELRIWSVGGTIYLAEPGRGVRELALGDTAEARRLRALLQQHGATDFRASVRLDRTLLAGGGGDGFHWSPPGRSANAGRPAATPAADSSGAQSQDRPTTTTRPASGATGDTPGGPSADGH
jgi:hypothetical protein